MQCRQCAAEIPADSSFCNRCGATQVDERPARAPGKIVGGPPATEETLWTGRYALKSAMHLWILWALWIAAIVAACVLLVPERSTKVDLFFLGAALLPGLWMLAKALGRKFSTRYRLTNQRLFTERGLIARRSDEIELIRVDDVAVRQNVLQRLCGVGTVLVVSSDATNPELAIEGVERPLELKELIRAEVRARRARTTFLETL